MNKSLPSDGSKEHDRLEDQTINTDRQAVVRQMCGKRELNLEGKLEVLCKEVRLNRKPEPNQEVFYAALRSLKFVPAQWLQARTGQDCLHFRRIRWWQRGKWS